MKYLFLILAVLSITFSSLSQKRDLDKGLYVSIQTNKGDIFLELYPESAPMTVANFVGLAEGKLKVFDTIKHKEPYFDGIVFHRVISDFMIQSGDPTGTGSGGPGYKFFDEADNGLKHNKGSLSMANAGPNTNGSQFFITHVATPHLNGKHTVFGQVLEGQDVVDIIEQGDTMISVKIVKKGLKYKWFYNPSKVFRKAYKEKEGVVEKERLEQEKKAAQNKVRVIEAKAKTEEEYKAYFYEIIKEIDPNAKQTNSGLVYSIDSMGSADKMPVAGDPVSLHYIGRFLYGKEFDSSRKRGKPLSFNYKKMSLIKGFDEGIALIGEKGSVTLYIPYFLAYGKNGRPPKIPPYADLIFEIELLSVEKEN
jgi:cyclophilin family peptidyl-prolyl cis-trans isomerase